MSTIELLIQLRDVGEGNPCGRMCHAAADEIEKQDIQKAVLVREIERLKAELDAADDLLCCAEASQHLEAATASDWDDQMDAWRTRNSYGNSL